MERSRPAGRRLLDEALSLREARALVQHPVWRGDGIDGDGQPVVLVPGFLQGDRTMLRMASWLRRTGHSPRRSGLVNSGCGEKLVRRLEIRVEGVADDHGERVALVGHSRGGWLARVLAVRRPKLVAGVITLGAPPLDHRAVNPIVAGPTVAFTALGTLGFPGLMRASCFRGECCARFRDDLHAPMPDEVPFVAVYSRRDGIVDWSRVSERHATRVEVDATHYGLIANPDSYAAVAEALRGFREKRSSR